MHNISLIINQRIYAHYKNNSQYVSIKSIYKKESLISFVLTRGQYDLYIALTLSYNGSIFRK